MQPHRWPGETAPIDNSQALNIPLQAQAILDVVYGNTSIQNGQEYTPEQLTTRPNRTCGRHPFLPSTTKFPRLRIAVVMRPVEGIALTGEYTVFIADFSAIGNPDPEVSDGDAFMLSDS